MLLQETLETSYLHLNRANDNYQEMLAGIQLAMLYFKEIQDILESINRYAHKKNLITATYKIEG